MSDVFVPLFDKYLASLYVVTIIDHPWHRYVGNFASMAPYPTTVSQPTHPIVACTQTLPLHRLLFFLLHQKSRFECPRKANCHTFFACNCTKVFHPITFGAWAILFKQSYLLLQEWNSSTPGLHKLDLCPLKVSSKIWTSHTNPTNLAPVASFIMVSWIFSDPASNCS